MTEGFILTGVGTLLAFFAVAFLVAFVRPWFRMRRNVGRAIAALDEHYRAARENHREVTKLDRIEEELSVDDTLVHLWREFRHTLHAEHSESDADEHGQPLTTRYRQTVPAEMFFSTRSLIDVPLSTDFFKHLPGVLTGLGIIGTFAGLIAGLSQFDVSGDPDKVNASVGALVDAVRGAFYISASAIALAITITAVEKVALARLHARVQRLQYTIDRMFDSGAGEDYLSDIARESEQSATHLAHLKEGLVNDIKHLLDDFGQRQGDATLSAAQLISDSVTSTLEAPLTTMASAMERSLEDQQMVVHKLMDQSLDAFAERLESMVGAKLTDAAGHVEAAAGSMRAALDEVPQQVGAAAEELRRVLGDIASSAEPMAANAERMTVAAERLATTVEQSAETLDYAIERIRRLGDQLGGAMQSAEEVGRALESGAREARAAADALDGTGEQLETAQQRLAAVVQAFAEVADRAERNGAVNAELAEAVERAADQLADAQRNVDDFMQGLAGVLGETHEAFAREINGTLDRTHEAFHHNLANATERLAGTVHGFGDFLETDFKDSVDRFQRELARLGAHGNGQG